MFGFGVFVYGFFKKALIFDVGRKSGRCLRVFCHYLPIS